MQNLHHFWMPKISPNVIKNRGSAMNPGPSAYCVKFSVSCMLKQKGPWLPEAVKTTLTSGLLSTVSCYPCNWYDKLRWTQMARFMEGSDILWWRLGNTCTGQARSASAHHPACLRAYFFIPYLLSQVLLLQIQKDKLSLGKTYLHHSLWPF